MQNLFLVALCLLANRVRAGDDVYCRDERNQKVEWFVMYKFPVQGVNYVKVKRGFNTDGLQFAYFDSNTRNFSYWNMSSETLYSQSNPLAFTLKKLFEKQKSPNIAYATYNDQPFTGDDDDAKEPKVHAKEYAHSKGILMADKTTGMWLVHSTPQFPVNVHMGQFNMTRTARKNGQYFMCVTVPFSEVDKIAELLLIQSVVVHHTHWVKALVSLYPHLRALIMRKRYSPPKTTVEIAKIKGINKTIFTAIAKPVRWEKDIYTHTITELAKSDIWVQSWRRPIFGWLYPVCDRTYSVKDVDKLRFNFNSTSYLEYSYLYDHSKFAVAVNTSLFCFSSLNRAKTQFKRGGELLCRENKDVAGLFRRTVAKVEACNATEPSGKPKPPTVPGGTTTTRKPWQKPTTPIKPPGKWTTTTPVNKPTKSRPTKATRRTTAKPASTKSSKRPTTTKTKKTRKPNIPKTNKKKSRPNKQYRE
uniref:Putative endonuclease n=1 Tax=Ixodes ricinus TaxID=34613 RepID=A0A0K8RBE0_IXORI